jgi:hypothetical protein
MDPVVDQPVADAPRDPPAGADESREFLDGFYLTAVIDWFSRWILRLRGCLATGIRVSTA